PHSRPLTGHTDRVTALTAVPGPDGTTLLATAGDDAATFLWTPTKDENHYRANASEFP
ncbi:hypothetical protein Ga0074812_13394, partial [Parafrankia irregularis]